MSHHNGLVTLKWNIELLIFIEISSTCCIFWDKIGIFLKDCIVINIKSRYFSKWIQRRKFIENVSIELIRLLLQILQIKFEYFIIHFRFCWQPVGPDMTHRSISKYHITFIGISSEFSENVKNPVSHQTWCHDTNQEIILFLSSSSGCQL